MGHGHGFGSSTPGLTRRAVCGVFIISGENHAKGHKARSFVVLGDDAVPHSRKQHEDNTTVQRVLAIRRRLPDVRVVAQLRLERNAHRLAREDVRVVCCDAFKYARNHAR